MFCKVLTCNKEVATKAHTTQAVSGGGEVSSRGPSRGASGPGLGGGQVQVVRVPGVSSGDNQYLHSECYNTLI